MWNTVPLLGRYIFNSLFLATCTALITLISAFCGLDIDSNNGIELYEIYCFLAKEITGCPVSWTGVIDNEKQFVLARDGFPDEVPMEMPREQTLCQFAIEKTEPLIINDMTIDYRFKNHPAVVDFGVKFYAAFPVTTSDGYTLGTLCVSDNRVRRLTKNKIKLLKGLSDKSVKPLLKIFSVKLTKFL